MPGNDTKDVISPRAFFPLTWIKTGITAGQSPGVPMDLMGGSIIKTFPLPRDTSIVTVGIILSAAVATNFIRFGLTVDDVEQAQTIDMDPAAGLQKLVTFAPGKFVVQKGERIGVNWGSHGSLTPSGTIEAIVAFEVQWP